MKIKRLSILIFMILLVSIFMILYAFHDRNASQIDVVKVNDIAESLSEQWESLEQNGLPCLKYKLDYVVLGNDNNFLTATRRGLNEDINSAISNRDTIVDIKSNNRIIGKLIIFNDTNQMLEQYRKYLLNLSIFMMIFIAILCSIYAIYIDRFVFRPFRKLQNFARQVAAGKLDMPLKMDKGNMFGAFTESFDLMREELARARENERIANQSKKELVASLSHDIKTPVSSIKAVSEVMYAKTKDESVRSKLQVINSKADQINTLITNMFNATLEELQELKVTVTEQSSQLLYDLVKDADYNDQITVSSIPECIVLVDELRLAQVIDNVISNSYKYAGTSINVSVYINEKYLEIDFKDYGLGVTDNERPLIFNKYYRAENSVGKSGTGLGLYISKYLMNNMSGDITCANKEDGFIVKLKILIA